MTSSASSDHPTSAEPVAGVDVSRAPSIGDIHAAAQRIAGQAVRTPLLESPGLNDLVGGRVLLKAESLQRPGSVKFRGAFNRISQLSEAERQGGVIAFSSGNHAAGVALAARLTGIAAVIVMPEDAPRMKIAATRAYGAEVVLIERDDDLREKVAAELAAERGATLVRPFDDFNVIAGQGTVGLEIVEQCEALGVEPDAVLCPCGGGGLISGTATALQDRWPGLPIHAAEPEGFDDTARSLASGRRLRNTVIDGSICDALLVPTPGVLTFQINVKRLASGFAVSDAQTEHAMIAAFQHLKLVLEPGGAVALAALLAGRYDCGGKTTVVVASGGNVDADLYADVLTSGSPSGQERAAPSLGDEHDM